MSGCLLECRGLHYHYPDGTPALGGIDLQIGEGEAVALVGANGSGKTSLLLHLIGCLHASSGTIHIGGRPLAAETLQAIRRQVGFLMQDPDDQLFMPTVEQDVAFGPLNMGLSAEEAAARAQAALARTGIEHLAQRPPHRLSGGEKRSAALAAVLASGPDILLLDEPSAGLDPRARRRAIALLKGFEHLRIVATHDLDLAREVCERTVVLSRGIVAADGKTAELLDDQALLERCGL